MSGCKIGKVKLKSGAKNVIPVHFNNNSRVFAYDFGEITVRTYDNHKITNETLLYFLELAKNSAIYGE